MPSVVIKLSSGLNKTVEVANFDITVAELKELAAADIDIPADQQRPVFKGKMIKDTDKLSTLGVTEGSAIHVVRGRGAAPAPPLAAASTPASTTSATAETPSTPQATPGVPPQAPNPYASLFGGNNDASNTGFGGWGAGAGGDAGANFNNPAAMMAGMNPQLLQQMMQSMGGGGMGGMGAGGAGGEQAAAMQMMQNPQMMNMVSQMVAQNPQFLIQTMATNPMFQNMPPQQREMLTQIMSNPQMFQQMMQMSQAFGGAAGGAGGMPDISALFGGGGAGAAGGGSGGFGIPPVANPREAYAQQLGHLREMGFPNEQANIAALQMSQGNVEFAIERLLSGGM